MKKGQGQLVAFVLLIGFTIVIGIMVGNWMIKQSRKMGESAAGGAEVDARCADVGIALVCDGGPKIKNTGRFTVKLGKGGKELLTTKISTEALSIGKTVIPFIEIEGREYGCSHKAVTVTEDTCPA